MSSAPREALLGKAVDHFVVHGVGDISLRALAAEIGSSHRMLIYHFGSREGLLAAAAAHVWHTQQKTMAELADAVDGDPAESAWQYWTMVADRSAVAPLVLEMSAQAMHGAPWQDAFRDGHEQIVRQMAERLGDHGESPERAAVLARMAMAMILGALWELRLTGDRAAVDAAVRTFLDQTWPPPPGARRPSARRSRSRR